MERWCSCLAARTPSWVFNDRWSGSIDTDAYIAFYDEYIAKGTVGDVAGFVLEPIQGWGGSIMPPEVTQAMEEAAQYFVPLLELQRQAGARIAELVGVPAAMVTAPTRPGGAEPLPSATFTTLPGLVFVPKNA